MTFKGADYLSVPPHLVKEKQTSPDDLTFAMSSMMEKYLREIRNELRKLNPTVLATTVVEGGNLNISGGYIPHRVWFEVSGKPVRIYKLMTWTQQGGTNIAFSFDSMGTTQHQGWSQHIDGTDRPYPEFFPVAIDQMYIQSSSGCSVNVPYDAAVNVNTCSIYGWTIPQEYEPNY